MLEYVVRRINKYHRNEFANYFAVFVIKYYYHLKRYLVIYYFTLCHQISNKDTKHDKAVLRVQKLHLLLIVEN